MAAFSPTRKSERGKSLQTFYPSSACLLVLIFRITRAFMIEELNSIKQRASAEAGKKKGKKGKKSTKK